ncbi:SWIM zinc finger family protein [Chitinophaga pendula]|uniref:SWIM zinc finger family protein n=1 Tax=Chitinophaga TaxID=79328 RepID=UPI000BAF2787|nr:MULTISPECIES: SWIM zinc finger family protein [Chitinophaga]ASZ09943.1 hypothetical protein CK934_02575 [Chitinophaga sp. MD30]UCJ07117.1 SWIM zinc finger family protein [Chitinophaga pendula]
MRTLDNFDAITTNSILTRGREAYSNGTVTALQALNDNEWQAFVNGTTTYTVKVILHQQEIIDATCDCPDNSTPCKHIVATWFALRHHFQRTPRIPASNPPATSPSGLLVAARQALTTGDLHTARQLIHEGLNNANAADRPGLLHKWQLLLLELASATNDLPTVRQYAKQFAFHPTFNTTWYRRWKQTYDPDTWTTVISSRIEEITAQINNTHTQQKGQVWSTPHTWMLEQLAPVYIEEQYWHKLLALVQEETDIQLIMPYHHHLLPHYPAELLAIYLPALERMGDRSGNRIQFILLAGIFRQLLQSMPEAHSELIRLLQHLIQKYHRRPALANALSEVLGSEG